MHFQCPWCHGILYIDNYNRKYDFPLCPNGHGALEPIDYDNTLYEME